ncbi:MAG TPA: hypothetical protein VG755_14095 [Nannocystaceae bacterium]|nr:hypothetical protein [Nannocystaceae bacterium]
MMTSWIFALVLAAPGELLVGADALAVDDAGKITADGKAKAVSELEESAPGGEAWTLHLWAKIDKGVEGPMYVEFHRDHGGERLLAHRVELDFDGGQYLAQDVDISRSQGFRIGDTIEVSCVQIIGGKDITKAKGKLKLVASSKPPPKEAPGEAKEEVDPNEASEIASTPSAGPDGGAPPKVESGDKKGCSIAGASTMPWLWLLGIAAIRRRRA